MGAEDRAIVVEDRAIIQRQDSKDSVPAGWNKDVVVRYPFISGLKDKAVLARVQTAATLKKVLGSSVEKYKSDLIGWLYEVNYRVNYNRDYILDITFWQSGSGAYPDTQYGHLTLNLKTGKEARAGDIFDPSSMHRLAALVDRKLHAYINKTIKDWSARGTDGAQGFPPNARFRIKDLNAIRVDERGVTFLWEFGFPYALKALEPPDGGFFFTYDELKPYLSPNGLLGVNIH